MVKLSLNKLLLILSFTLGLTSVASAGFHDKISAAALLENGKIIHQETVRVRDRRNNKEEIVTEFYVTMDMIAYKCWVNDRLYTVECFEYEDLGVSSELP